MQYLYTERAHLMCPRMNFGMVLAVRSPYEEDRIRDALEQLSAAHPFLNALLGYEGEKNAYYYRVTDHPTTELRLKGAEIPGADAPEVIWEYETLTSRDWNLFTEGMLKAAAWPMGGGTCFLLAFHHLLADGRGALGLAEDLADCYVSGERPKYAGERLITELPENSRMPLISRLLVRQANRSQAAEKKAVSYQEYHAFADEFLKRDPVRHTVVSTAPEELDSVRKQCHEQGITVNDWLAAKLMKEDHTGKVIMACDLRDQLACYQEGALGNYSTAFSVEAGPEGKDLFLLARNIHAQVRRKLSRPRELWLVLQCYANLDPAVLDAACIACRGGYPSRPGKFIGSRFFGFDAADGYSITNLGKIESGNILSAYFIPPASPAIRKTQGVLTVNGVMAVCTSER